MENKDKQSALMLIDLAEKLSDLPACCRVYLMKQFIYLIDFNIDYNDKNNFCYCYVEKN